VVLKVVFLKVVMLKVVLLEARLLELMSPVETDGVDESEVEVEAH